MGSEQAGRTDDAAAQELQRVEVERCAALVITRAFDAIGTIGRSDVCCLRIVQLGRDAAHRALRGGVSRLVTFAMQGATVSLCAVSTLAGAIACLWATSQLHWPTPPETAASDRSGVGGGSADVLRVLAGDAASAAGQWALLSPELRTHVERGLATEFAQFQRVLTELAISSNDARRFPVSVDRTIVGAATLALAMALVERASEPRDQQRISHTRSAECPAANLHHHETVAELCDEYTMPFWSFDETT